MNLQRAQVYEEVYSWLVSLYKTNGNTTTYNGIIRALRKTLERGGLSLSDIGISEKEIEELRIEACRRSAEMWLGFLRKKPPEGYVYNNGEAYLFNLRQELKSADLLLSDIGTSEEELISFLLVPA